jgi:hypothetical protein
VRDGDLAGDAGGESLVAVLDDLQQVGQLLSGERTQSKVIEEKDVEAEPASRSNERYTPIIGL